MIQILSQKFFQNQHEPDSDESINSELNGSAIVENSGSENTNTKYLEYFQYFWCGYQILPLSRP